MHFISPLHHWTNTILDSPPVTIFMTESVCRDSLEAIGQPEEDSYNDVPRSEKAQQTDDRLEMVQHWLETLE
jgi:hypothetical protein